MGGGVFPHKKTGLLVRNFEENPRSCLWAIGLFTVSFSHMHYNVIQRGCKAILGLNYKIARSCLTYMLDFNVMQMSKANHERGCWFPCSFPLGGTNSYITLMHFLWKKLYSIQSEILFDKIMYYPVLILLF